MKNFTSQNVAKRQLFIEGIQIAVSGHKTEKFLGVAKLTSAKSEAQVVATMHLVELWENRDDVIGMSFDTTASNTGNQSGVCKLLEVKIGRNLLYFACRLHVRGVFQCLFGSTKGPNIPLLERFQQKWNSIDQKRCQPLENNPWF